MKKIFFVIILAIFSVSLAFAAPASKEILDSDTLDLVLDAKQFMGKTGEETVSNIEIFIKEAKKIRGLRDASIAYIADNNLHGSLAVKKKDYKKALDKRGIEQLKKELESDVLVNQIWVWYNEIYIKFKQKLYSNDMEVFVGRHPDLPAIPTAYNEIKDIVVSLKGVPSGQAEKYRGLLKNKFPDKIK